MGSSSLSSIEFPVAIFDFPNSAIGRKSFRPNKTYPQHNKGPVAEYFVCPKMAHPVENTGDVDCISFKSCRFNRLTHGCLESLQSANPAIANTNPSSLHFRLQALSPVCLRKSRSTSPESRSFWRIPSRVMKNPVSSGFRSGALQGGTLNSTRCPAKAGLYESAKTGLSSPY